MSVYYHKNMQNLEDPMPNCRQFKNITALAVSGMPWESNSFGSNIANSFASSRFSSAIIGNGKLPSVTQN